MRSRLARLSGYLGQNADGDGSPQVSTYHAFAATLLREFGLLLPVEPDARLLSETERWQLAYEVVCSYPEPLPIGKTPAAVTAMVLTLSDELAEHLIDTDELRHTHVELERLVHTLPAGPRQRGDGPNRRLLDMLDTQTGRLWRLVDTVDGTSSVLEPVAYALPEGRTQATPPDPQDMNRQAQQPPADTDSRLIEDQ